MQLAAPGDGGVHDHLECLQRHWSATGFHHAVIRLSNEAATLTPLSRQLQELAGRPGFPRTLTLLLHYSGYGFHRRGLCFWLLREVENARKVLGDRLRVVTLFHELFAFGPPWRSAFWLAGAQAWIASRLAVASDRLLTNSSHHEHVLRSRLAVRVPITVWPVFSNVGEPEKVPLIAQRESRLVVFGSPSTRRRALGQLAGSVKSLQRLGIREVIEVGPGESSKVVPPVFRHLFAGRLEPGELRKVLERSRFALIDYPTVHLGKSSVFAAHAAHGNVVLNTCCSGPDADGLAAGRHYLLLAAGPLRDIDLQSVSDAGRDWYRQHSLPLQAQTIGALCAGL